MDELERRRMLGPPTTGAGIISALRAAGYIIVAADAIRLAQAHEREACRYEAANDNVPAKPKRKAKAKAPATSQDNWSYNKDGAIIGGAGGGGYYD